MWITFWLERVLEWLDYERGESLCWKEVSDQNLDQQSRRFVSIPCTSSLYKTTVEERPASDVTSRIDQPLRKQLALGSPTDAAGLEGAPRSGSRVGLDQSGCGEPQ